MHARPAQRREEVGDIHSQHAVAADVRGRVRTAIAAADETVRRRVSGNVRQDAGQDPVLAVLHA
ncbi:MAG: hypothetical protein IPK26_27585 [Planctomycetes bacterium]|nr:hypothetical protein [Planctomycetota bacterium]